MERTADDVVSRWLETIGGFVEMLDQAGHRSDVNVLSLKAQCFDLMLEAIKAGATQLAGDESPLEKRTCDRGQDRGVPANSRRCPPSSDRSLEGLALRQLRTQRGIRCGCGDEVAARRRAHLQDVRQTNA